MITWVRRVAQWSVCCVLGALLLAACSSLPRELASEATASKAASIEFPNLSIAEKDAAFDDAELAKLEARVKKFVTDGEAIGVSTVLVKDGKLVQHVRHGVRDIQTGAPVEEDTIFRLYSMSKPITSVAMMVLYEEGGFELDDPISKYLPELKGLRVLGEADSSGEYSLVDAVREPTMSDLLSHRAGFSYGFVDLDPTYSIYSEKQLFRAESLSDFTERLSHAPLLQQPGEKWVYSLSNDVQGAVIERITGKSFGAFLHEKVFEPLGMKDTSFYITNETADRFSDVVYVDPKDGSLIEYEAEWLSIARVNFDEQAVPTEFGGFGLTSTISDYVRFCQMLFNGGTLNGDRILKEETIQLMRTDRMIEGETLITGEVGVEDNGAGLGYGYGFGIVSDADLSVTPYGQGTYFWGGLAGTWFWIDPEHDFYYIGMVQVLPAGGPLADFRLTTANLIYDALAN